MARSSDDRILFQLKARGPQTASDLGAQLGMTATGARQHLCRLDVDGLVESELRRQGRGRPKKYWRLTGRGHGRFPDRHADLTLELLRAIKALFGDKGLERLARRREGDSLVQYRPEVFQHRTLPPNPPAPPAPPPPH